MAVGGRMQVLMEIIVRNHKVVFANSSIHLAFFQFSHLQLAALTLTNTFPFMAVVEWQWRVVVTQYHHYYHRHQVNLNFAKLHF